MLTRANRLRLGLILLGVLLLGGFFTVLERRFAEGGLYPHYASFRTDPMGTSAYYETLDRLEGIEVSRNLKSLNNLKELDGETVILLLGYPREDFDNLRAPVNSEVMRAVDEGGRLVITLNPELVPEAFKPKLSEKEEDWVEERRRIREERMRRALEREQEKEESDGGDDRKEGDKEDESERLEQEMVETAGPLFTTYTGFDFLTLEGFERPEGGWETESGEALASGGIPSELPNWRSQFRLKLIDPAWKSVALVDGKPVVIERQWGRGSIVVTTDSYFVSNESLHFGAEAGFLLWLLGDKTRVVFDETIHGTVETGGAMKLIRRYRAQGVFLGLLVFLILWAWRSASTLVPGCEENERGLVSGTGAVAGEETGSGFTRLLRRSVPPSALLSECVEVWRGSLSAATPPVDTASRIDGLVAEHRRDPKRHGIVETYHAITDLLRKR